MEVVLKKTKYFSPYIETYADSIPGIYKVT